MTLYLDKEQGRLVQRALEAYQKTLKVQSKGQEGDVKELVEAELFQLDLLVTWFDRQREMEC